MAQQTSLTYNDQLHIDGTVECLGMTFENGVARRAYFVQKLREKLQDPAFRQIEGFPIGSDEDILALSDPPYYTACPNPFIADFIEHYGTPYDPNMTYNKEPFAADVSEGKGDAIYNAHSYHTKVPHKAIMRYILHYTKPGDVVLDGFCGTGMTGVAAQLCDSPDPEFKAKIEQEWKAAGLGIPKWGARRAILSDLSPAATFISYNYNTPTDVANFVEQARFILNKTERELGWMFATLHQPEVGQIELGTSIISFSDRDISSRLSKLPIARVVYTIWSDVFLCPYCGQEVIFWNSAVDKQKGKVYDEFPCAECGSILTKRTMERAWKTQFDSATQEVVKQVKQVPVLINYTYGKKRFEKAPDSFDLALLSKIESSSIPDWYPINRMPVGDESRRNDDIGITHANHFFTKRNLWIISACNRLASNSFLKWAITGIIQRASKQHQIAITRIGGEKAKQGGATAGHRRGTLYVPSNQVEFHPLELLLERVNIISKTVMTTSALRRDAILSTGSAAQLDVPSASVDYIFVDPPFGGNIMYSELNFQWEGWLKVFTNSNPEAITNKSQNKGLFEYQDIMSLCFQEFYRVLKPGRWMTVEFHNSKNSVWNAIQEALQRAGFVIADVRTLNKGLLTHTQRTAAGSVSQDLVISAYKPNGGLEDRFKIEAGNTEGVWDFVRTHLKQLPVFVHQADGRADVIDERLNYLLFDRMVAFHVQRGVPVPLSASQFYAGLQQKFAERDGMFFLSDQVAEYERKRMNVRDVQQLHIFVSDEVSAIQWLRQQLSNKPQTTGELTPQFMQELAGWQKHELLPELVELLDQNFLRYDGTGPIPAQIVAWLKKSTEMRELVVNTGRELDDGSVETSNQQLITRARDRWYVPDPNKAIDLDNLRKKALLREFNIYATSRGKLKQFRTEAIRAGFSHAYNEKQYATIVSVAERLPESVLQEDPTLLMYYDTASLRV